MHQILRTSNGEPPNPKYFLGSKNSFLLSCPTSKNLLNSTVKLFFKSDPKRRSYRRKNGSKGLSRCTIALECTVTPVKYNGSARSRWQIHKYVGIGLLFRKKSRKFLTREEPRPKSARTSDILRTTYRKKF